MDLQMVFETIEECNACIAQINTNLGYPNAITTTWDLPKRIINENCIDYLNGLMWYILKPTGGRARRGLLPNVTEVFNYVELEFNPDWDYCEPNPVEG